MPKQDIIEVEILEDGTMKLSTDKVSMPNHVNAEGLLKAIATACGGVTKRVRKLGISLHAALHAHAADGHTHDHGEHHSH